MDSMDFYRQGNLERYLSDDYLKDGTVTIVRLFDDRAGTTIITPPELAKKLLKEESNRYSFAKKIEVPELEFEKLIVENAKRDFAKKGGGAKFNRPDTVEPGGEDYTELVFKIKKGGMDVGIPVEAMQEIPIKDVAGKVVMEKSLPYMATVPFKNPAHMDIKSEIAHVRFKTRNLNDMKVLTVEEMQSDFAIAARKAAETNQSGKKITDFPFKNTWYEMTTKRLIRYAADNGFDAVAIPKGSVAATRYGQDIAHIKNLKMIVEKNPKGKTFMDIDGSTVLNNSKDTFIFKINGLDGKLNSRIMYQRKDNEVYDILKKYKVSDKIKNKIDDILSGKKEIEPTSNTFEFSTIPVPGEVIGSGKGKYELYDKAIPGFMKKYAKKWNAKVYDDNIKVDPTVPMDSIGYAKDKFGTNIPVTIIKLTPEMKKAVQTDGQALFSIFGLGGVGASVVSDSIKNNTISNQTIN
jgi:hypothetical protein